jgi:flagellar hook-associated protein 1 FlgK
VDGVQLVSGRNVLDSLEAYDAGGGQYLVRTLTGGTALNITGGTIQGTIEARDGDLVTLRGDLDTLAGALITQVNTIHSAGYGLNGTTGAAFFTGTDASDIGFNQALADDPSLIQASGASGQKGNNAVVLQLAQLAKAPQAALAGQTFLQHYGQTTAKLGQYLNGLNTQLSNQQIVEQMLLRQRDSVSGVSLDEEMTDLVRFQRAFEASARLITTVDEMLETVVNLKR